MLPHVCTLTLTHEYVRRSSAGPRNPRPVYVRLAGVWDDNDAFASSGTQLAPGSIYGIRNGDSEGSELWVMWANEENVEIANAGHMRRAEYRVH